MGISVDAPLEDPASGPGVYSDGIDEPNPIDNVTVGLYAGANTAARFRLKPQRAESCG